MSRSRPAMTNPAKRFFRWSGDEGKVTYYDKEKKENVEVTLPFNFMVLDELSTITGYSERQKQGFWSNEVRNIREDTLVVRTKNGIQATGTYGDISDKIKTDGAKYAKSIYVACYIDGEFSICNFQASGAALTAWIEFSREVGTPSNLNGMVSLTGGAEAKKGKVVYYTPVFEVIESTKEEYDATWKLDEQLQAYLDKYLAQPVTEPAADTEDISIEDVEDEEIDLSDIPFD